MGVDGREQGDALSARNRRGHQAGLREGAGAVVHAGVGHLHAGQRAHQRLELEYRLQRPLADLRLIRGISGGELAAADDVVDDGRDEVPVAASTEKTGHLAEGAGLARPPSATVPASARAAEGKRQVQRGVAVLGRDVGEELNRRADADRRQHRPAVFLGVGDRGWTRASFSKLMAFALGQPRVVVLDESAVIELQGPPATSSRRSPGRRGSCRPPPRSC